MAAANGVTSTELHSWIEKCVETENFSEFKISLTGKSEKGDGYVGDIVFANVKGTDRENGSKELHLVIKHGKSNDYLREVVPVRAAFETEIHFYGTVLPEFRKFQLHHNVQHVFDSYPKCYKTLMLDNMEVLVLENLNKSGYRLYDKLKPMNLNHHKIVLTEYGKLHAISFALKDQHPETFASLTADRPDCMLEFLTGKGIKEMMRNVVAEVQEMLQQENEISLLEKFRGMLTKEPVDIMIDLFSDQASHSVITHGDCWNNNFLFKYERGDSSTPSKVALLDFQLSLLRSPVFDLIYFIYSTSSEEQLNNFEGLIEVYYSSLSNFLKQLGSDPEKLFPYSTLKEHLRKYSFFGVLHIQSLLKFVLCSKEDAPVMEELKEGENFEKFGDINLMGESKDLYYQRVKAVLNHYFECAL